MKILEMIVYYDDKEIKTTREEDLELIESDFNDLIYHKYVFKSNWVKRVVERTNYNGTRTITFTLDNRCKYKFLISSK